MNCKDSFKKLIEQKEEQLHLTKQWFKNVSDPDDLDHNPLEHTPYYQDKIEELLNEIIHLQSLVNR